MKLKLGSKAGARLDNVDVWVDDRTGEDGLDDGLACGVGDCDEGLTRSCRRETLWGGVVRDERGLWEARAIVHDG